MMRHNRLKHRFVMEMPDKIEPGILYVSTEYGSAVHVCCCGCGEEIVTPLTPTDWKVIYDGESISLHPSIGNWTLPCQSHYVIWRGDVIEAEPWTEQRIEAARQCSHEAKVQFYRTDGAPAQSVPAAETEVGFGPLWQWLKKKE